MLELQEEGLLYQPVSSEDKIKVKKLVAVLATSMSVIVAREKKVDHGKNPRFNFAQVLYIRYPINIRKKFVSALFNSGSEISAIHLTFTKELGLPIRLIDIKMQKIDGIILDTYGMVVAAFLIKDKAN